MLSRIKSYFCRRKDHCRQSIPLEIYSRENNGNCVKITGKFRCLKCGQIELATKFKRENGLPIN